jgi:hypothetical protein
MPPVLISVKAGAFLMKTALAAGIVVLFSAWYGPAAQAQVQTAANQRVQVAPPTANLNAILTQIQQATSSASANIAKLRIEKWKTDAEQKQQLQQVAESLQKNIANAVPGLVTDVQSSRGSVLTSFKLYHNLNVLYEFLSSLADAAGSLGKKDEYEPLAADATALDTVRQNLSIYIEQAAVKLEAANRAPVAPVQAQPPDPSTQKKVIVIDENNAAPKKTAKPTKKKSSTPSTPASAKPSATPTPTPH